MVIKRVLLAVAQRSSQHSSMLIECKLLVLGTQMWKHPTAIMPSEKGPTRKKTKNNEHPKRAIADSKGPSIKFNVASKRKFIAKGGGGGQKACS